MSVTLFLENEAATHAFGGALVAALPATHAGWQLLFDGELGAGKTSTVRAMLRALGHEGAVPSPTYTLVEPYELASGKVYHVDLYRIVEANELEFLGWSELNDGLLLVEWPQRAPAIEATADLKVALEYRGDGRAVTVAALSERALPILERLTDASVTP